MAGADSLRQSATIAKIDKRRQTNPGTTPMRLTNLAGMGLLVWLLASAAAVLLALRPAAGADLPAANTVVPVAVVRTNDYTEGVVVDHEGNLYFSHEKIVTKVTPDGKASTWARTGSPNGHKVLADGTHLICDASRHALLHLDALGHELKPAATESDGRPLRGPNDLTLDTAAGGVYFTDPAKSDATNADGTIHYLDSRGVCHTVASRLAFPNGIALRPDGQELLVAESKQNRILVFLVLAPGKLGEPRTLIDLPKKGRGQIDNQPDGIALDSAGNLYVAHYGMRQVQVVSPEGKLVRRYPGGNLTTSNVAFAGPAMDQLYMTGGEPGALFRLNLPGVKGLTILPPRSDK
jgi:gluconolactonase